MKPDNKLLVQFSNCLSRMIDFQRALNNLRFNFLMYDIHRLANFMEY